jgi:hypothetical protein
MKTTVIDVIADFTLSHRKGGFKLNTLRKYVNGKGLVVSNETITRALRQLRLEGTVSYEYDTAQGLYRFN